jgi:HSP20 family protein
MADEENDPFRRRKKDPTDPFDILRGFGLGGKDFERMFEEMQRSISDMLRNMGNIEPGKPYVHGFTFKMGPDGKPMVSEFGNKPSMPVKGKPVFTDQREPITDIIEDAKTIAVTVEMPGIEKKDIDLRVTETEVEMNVDTERRKYHKLIKLPKPVKPSTTKATYKNGVLDLTVEKIAQSEPKKGVRVNVD